MHNSHGRHASGETVTTGIDPQTGASLATSLARLFSNNFRHVSTSTAPMRPNLDGSYAPFAGVELGRSRSPRPMLRRSSARTRSATPLTTSAPPICRIDVDAEGTLSKRHVHDLYDRIRRFSNVCVGNRCACEPLHNFLAELSSRADEYSLRRLASLGFPAFAK
jgi:hypothetical protein